jgi:hypothetical protein
MSGFYEGWKARLSGVTRTMAAVHWGREALDIPRLNRERPQ